jgi:hypothetical protein
VQVPVGGACPSGTGAFGIDSSQQLKCDVGKINVDGVFASGTSTGRSPQVAIRSTGEPVIAYVDAGQLKLMLCNDRLCLNSTIRTLDAGPLRAPSLQLTSNNLAVVAYIADTPQDLKLYLCADVLCTSGVSRTPVAADSTQLSVALRLNNDVPVIAFDRNNALGFYACVNTTCNTGSVLTLDSTPGSGDSVAMDLRADKRPVIAYYQSGPDDLYLYDCADTGCNSGSIRALDTAANTGANPSIVVRSNDMPIIAYVENLSFDLRRYDCTVANCNSGSATTLVTTGSVQGTSMILKQDGTPLISYTDTVSTVGRYVYNCTTANCSSGSASTLRLGSSVSTTAGIALRPDGRIALAYKVGVDARLLICGTFDCGL